MTLFRSTFVIGLQKACLVDKKTGSMTIFVLRRSSYGDSARGKLQSGDQILSINGQQIKDQSKLSYDR